MVVAISLDCETRMMANMQNQADAENSLDSVVVHLAYPIWRKQLLVGVARAKELQDQGHDVTVTYCNATRGCCSVNFFRNPLVCAICRTRARQTASDAGLKLVPLTVPTGDLESNAISEQERAKLVQGVQSAITSTFRSLPGDASAMKFIRMTQQRYLQTAMHLLASMKSVLSRFPTARVEVFNGRQACSGFALVAAAQRGFSFNTLEITATNRPIVFRGHTPHDRIMVQQRIRSHPSDESMAEQFYQQRREPRGNRYTKKQRASFKPPSSDGFNKRVAIFLSSQDEFEALGSDWESPFDDYAGVLEEISKRHPETLFCIRFHPNQADMTSDVITPFNKIATRNNVKLFLPDDSINTYGLIDWSDTVVTFGSTVTVEACWMGKPVILLGRSFFDNLDVAYIPKNLSEACELLGQDLQPMDRSGAAKFASYHLTDGDSLKYISEGKPFVADGFHCKHPVLGRVARVTDNVLCNCVKRWMASRLQSQRREAA
jgi:hypothetical protein